MKSLLCCTALFSMLFIGDVSRALSQTQTVEGFTFIETQAGPKICLGRWIPPTDVALPGRCEGQIIDASQLTAVSSGLTSGKLDQLLNVLTSIDQRLAVNNDQVRRIVETAAAAGQSGRSSVALSDAINKRFDSVPEDIKADDRFREELARLREDILRVVERY